MAIQADYVMGNTGITITKAYIVVHRVFGGKHEGGFNSVVRVYKDKTTCDSNHNNFISEFNGPQVPYSTTAAPDVATYQAMMASGGMFPSGVLV